MKSGNVDFNLSLNHACDLAVADRNRLVLRSNRKSDNFNAPDGKQSNNTAPMLLSRVDNTGPFTFSARVTPTFLETYDAGALIVYANERNWVKFAFERDERARTRIVTVRTIGTSDDNNHDVLTNLSVHLKISSNAQCIGYYYAVDRESWQLVRLHRNDYPSELWLGLSAQSPLGNGNQVAFEDCWLSATSIQDFRSGV